MRDALHPHFDRLIDVPGYLREFGNRPVLGPDKRPRARCDVCHQSLGVKAAKTDNNVGHFAHLVGGGKCLVKEKHRQPFLNLRPSVPDEAQAQELRAAFRRNLPHHLGMLGALVAWLSQAEFVNLVQRANHYNLWAYRGLTENQIPYALLLSADFPQATSHRIHGVPARRFWTRFWYDVRSLEDTWIRRPDQVSFYRAFFRAPRAGETFPDESDLVLEEVIPRALHFLDQPVRPFKPLWSERPASVLSKLLP